MNHPRGRMNRPRCPYCRMEVRVCSVVCIGKAMVKHWSACEEAPADLRQECNGVLVSMRPAAENMESAP